MTKSELYKIVDQYVRHEVAQRANEAAVSSADVSTMIAAALRRHAADHVALPDYALAASGAESVRSLTTPPYRSWAAALLRVFSRHGAPKQPAVVLDTDMNPGSCYAFAGNSGSVGVRLSRPVAVTAVTVDHISPLVAQNIQSAPQRFRVRAFADDAAVSANKYDELECGAESGSAASLCTQN